EQARQVAVPAKLLSGPRPTGMLEVIEHLDGVQMDPIRAVERTERLVLWSRLGAYDLVELDRAHFGPNPTLSEYWAFILPLRDFASIARPCGGGPRPPIPRAPGTCATGWRRTRRSAGTCFPDS